MEGGWLDRSDRQWKARRQAKDDEAVVGAVVQRHRRERIPHDVKVLASDRECEGSIWREIE